jgi:cell filamentation protein, protein adenylyltransferase
MRQPVVSTYQIPDLPPPAAFETLAIYKALVAAKAGLAELKGIAAAIPNQGILIDTLALQEAKASSEIENIVTTQDDLFKGAIDLKATHAGPVKEVSRYRDAIHLGWRRLQETQGLITNRLLIEQYRMLKSREDGFRETAGTVLQGRGGAVVYVPPQRPDNIQKHMTALERFINDDEASNLDPLIKMAIIHHQFESIHPFPDGNGRVGRMLNVLYLCKAGLLETPILYLSRAINAHKADYYRLLQAPREASPEDLQAAWEEWVVFILRAVAETADATIRLVKGMRTQMASLKSAMRDGALADKNIYSQDLLNNLFRHPYTRVEFVQKDLGVSRPTATKYLDLLATAGFLTKIRQGRNNYYVNDALADLFISVGEG